MKIGSLALAIAGIFLISLGFFYSGTRNKVTFENGIRISVEIADSTSERRHGLMYRESLADDQGMLFIFEDEKTRSFWMKNTLIPLDMIFINSNWSIVDILTDVPTCEKDPCPSYLSSEPAMYVLEVNAGFSKRNNLLLGQKVRKV